MVKAILRGLALGWFMLAGAMANVVYQPSDIPLLDNRFRIDPDVSEVTVVIHRRSNNSPAILVRPDGSKLYAWRYPEGKVRWLDADRYDIVTIDDPMPGPWQAIADYNVINRVRLYSDLQLRVSPVPLKIYAGERMKLTAAFERQGKTMPGEEFIDRLALTARLVSYQRPEDDNFSINEVELSRLQDNGREYDEVPGDGIYTYGTVFQVPAGKYKFIVAAANEVMTRAYQQDVLLYPNPIRIAVDSAEVGQPLTLAVTVDTDELQLDSIGYRGRIEGVGEMQPLHLSGTLTADTVSIPMPAPAESGHYRLNMLWVGTTLDGREVVLEPEEVRFTLFDPAPVVEEPPAAPPAPVAPQEELWQLTTWVLIAVSGVVMLLLLGGGGLWFVKRRNTQRLLQQDEAIAPSSQQEPQPAPISNEDIDLNKLTD